MFVRGVGANKYHVHLYVLVWSWRCLQNIRGRIFAAVFHKGSESIVVRNVKEDIPQMFQRGRGGREKQTKYCLCGLLCFVSSWRQIRGNTNTWEGKKMFFLSMKYVLWKLLLKGIFYLFGPSSRLVCEDMCLRLDPGAGRAVEKNLLCSLYTKTH